MARPIPIGLTVKVFRDHPTWDALNSRGIKLAWWEMPRALLDDLFVCSYSLTPDPDDPTGPLHPGSDIEWIESQHAGCVFVY